MADVADIMASIKHKISAEGADHVHSSAMKREHMDKILAWMKSACPEIGSALRFLSNALTKAPGTCGISVSDGTKKQITKYLQFLAFASTAWTIWTRYIQ